LGNWVIEFFCFFDSQVPTDPDPQRKKRVFKKKLFELEKSSDFVLDSLHRLQQKINMELANLLYNYELKRNEGADASALQQQIMKIVEGSDMVPLYQSLIEKYGWPADNSLVESMK
jgi:hypothetical protein